MPKNKTTQQQTLPNKIIPFMWYFFRKHKWKIFTIFSFILFNLIFEFTDKLLLREIIFRIETFSGSRDTILSSIILLIIGIIAFDLISKILVILLDRLTRNTIPYIRKDMNTSLLDHTHKHSYTYFTKNMSGSIAYKVNDIQSKILDDIYFTFSWEIIPNILFILFNIGIFFWIHPLFGSLIFLWTLFQISIMAVSVKKWNKAQKEQAEASSSVSGKITDSIVNFVNVKFFAREKFENTYLKKYADHDVKTDRRVWNMINLKFLQLVLCHSLFYSLIVFLPFYLYQQNEINLADIVYIFISTVTIMRYIWKLASSLPHVVRKIGNVNQALETLMQPYDIVDAPNAPQLKISKGAIDFNNIWFKYKKDWVIKGLNLSVKPGEKVGIVGQSGAGKTTLINLILRYFELSKGTIQIDQQGVSDVTQDSLRSAITVVSQESILFHRSLFENIRYGNPKASKAMVEKAAKQAHAHDFISKTTKGYNTEVGERGIKLSGGQRQRVCIARAILKDAPILLLDEATSALDSETERSIQDSFDQLMEGRTTLVIAHRLSTLRKMDRIIVMDKGKIIESGSHAQLLKKKGKYAKLWSMQVDGFIQE